MNRRAFLTRTTVGVTAGVALAGCGSDPGEDTETPTPTPTQDPPDHPPPDIYSPPEIPDEFDRIIDVVDEGADPTGETSITAVLDGLSPDGAVVYFPRGRYRVDDEWSVEGFERIAVIGPNATIVPDPGTEAYLCALDAQESGTALHVEGLTFDYSHPEAGGRMLHLKTPDGLVVRDVAGIGTVHERPSLVRVDVTDPDGSGLVERLQLLDGGLPGTQLTGCYVGNNSRGDITFRDCRIEGFPDNGLYADPPAGKMTVEGGRYANNGISNVRVRGGSIVRDVYVRCDENRRDFDNMRGIRLTDYEPQDEREPAVVENCQIDMLDVTHSDGAVELSGQLASCIVRDTHVRVDADNVPAFRVKSPDSTFAELGIDPEVKLERFSVEGTASGGEAIRIVDRNDCVFESIDIRQSGSNRQGFVFNSSTGNIIRDARIDVPGQAFVLENSDVETFALNVVERYAS